MKYINNTQGMVYIPRDGSNPTIALKPSEEVDIPTSRAVKGLTAQPPLLHETGSAPRRTTKVPKPKPKKVNTNAINNTKD